MPTISRMRTAEKTGLNIEMGDFGPIIKGKISLKPLTLLLSTASISNLPIRL